jgi:hypothetical protein
MGGRNSVMAEEQVLEDLAKLTKRIANKKSLPDEQFTKLDLKLTDSEKRELDGRLRDAYNERMNRMSAKIPSGIPRHDISQDKGDGTAGELRRGIERENEAIDREKADEIRTSMTENEHLKYLDEVAGKSGIGKKKFNKLNNLEKRAVRMAAGYKIGNKYEKLSPADRQLLNDDALPLYDAILKCRSENRVPSDGQIRRQFIADLIITRTAGEELGADREVEIEDELSPEESEKLLEKRMAGLKRLSR